MSYTRIAAVAALLLGLAGAGACDRREDPVADAAGGSMDGLSPEQIRQQAEPMSPERAEELGIIDSTIHVEQLTSPGDSMLMRDTVRDTVR